MSTEAVPLPVSPVAKWSGRVLSALPALLLTMSGVMKVTQNPLVIEGFQKMGYDPAVALPIGIVELVCTVLYVVPQTAVLGAVLLTGYLGGATATHVRLGEPWFGAVLIGVVLWLGLYLRDRRVRALLPWRRRS
jgi:hypothetical protein